MGYVISHVGYRSSPSLSLLRPQGGYAGRPRRGRGEVKYWLHRAQPEFSSLILVAWTDEDVRIIIYRIPGKGHRMAPRMTSMRLQTKIIPPVMHGGLGGLNRGGFQRHNEWLHVAVFLSNPEPRRNSHT